VQPEAGQDPPPTAGPAQPTAVQELQLLQAQLQDLQRERDRIAAAYAASQEAALVAAQATEIRQQLSILQAEILSMQPPPQQTIQPAVLPSAGPTVNVQPSSYGGTLRSTLDLRSPLSEGLQTSPWPATYKSITLSKFNAKTDPANS